MCDVKWMDFGHSPAISNQYVDNASSDFEAGYIVVMGISPKCSPASFIILSPTIELW